MTRDDRPGPSAALPACLVAALGPPAAWLAWVVTVALTTLAAGVVLGPAGRRPRPTVATVAVVAALMTLWLWWSSSDDSGLFVIGFALWVVPFLVAGPVLVALGAWLAGRRRTMDAPA